MKDLIVSFIMAGGALAACADSRVREIVRPVRVVWSTNATETARLLGERYGQVPEGRWANGSPAVLSAAGDAPSAVLLDFGRELHGGLQIASGAGSSNGDAQVRVRFGESVAEAMSELGERGACNDHAIRDSVIDLPWFGTREIGNTGFRFVRIDRVRGTVALESVRAVSLMRPMERLGSFRCSDERLNAIFETAVRTVHLCCQDYLWDGIKRDRLVWMGDTHPELQVILAVFGAAPVVSASLDFAAATTPADSAWMNTMPNYSLWWVRNLHDWYRQTGDRAYLARHHDYLKKLLPRVLVHIKEDGSQDFGGFLDWPTHHSSAAENAGTAGLLAMTLEEAAFLARELDDGDMASACEKGLARLRLRQPSAEGSKQAAALLALSGLRDPKEMFAETIGKGGVAGVSTFYGYYMLEAMSAAGENACALRTIRDYWGAMLDMGATSFWEDFNVAWTNNAFRIDELPVAGRRDIHGDYGEFCYKGFRHSLCHGWSAGPAAWLIRHVLGIRALDVGCHTVEVRPFLGDLVWAEGALATPAGAVHVKVRRDASGKTVATVSAPDGVQIVSPETSVEIEGEGKRSRP